MKRCLFCTFMWRNEGLLLQKFTLDIAWRQGNFKARSEASAKSKLTEKDDGRILYWAYLCKRAQHGPFVIEGKKMRRMMKLTEDTDQHVTFHTLMLFKILYDWMVCKIHFIPYFDSGRPPFWKKSVNFGVGSRLKFVFFFLVPQAIWLSEAEGPAVGSKIRIELAAPSIQFTPKSSRKQCSKAHVTHCILRQLISHNGWAMMRWKEGLGSNLTVLFVCNISATCL